MVKPKALRLVFHCSLGAKPEESVVASTNDIGLKREMKMAQTISESEGVSVRLSHPTHCSSLD